MTEMNAATPLGKRKCGATAKGTGAPCTRPAGWGTDHAGMGRCKLHGGISGSITHGRYSKIKRQALRDLIAEHASDPDPLDLLPDLAAVRAIFQDFVERYDAWKDALIAWHESYQKGDSVSKPTQILDVADAYRIVSEATKIVERIERIRSQNAISEPDFLRLMGLMGEIVKLHADEAAAKRIQAAWLALRR